MGDVIDGKFKRNTDDWPDWVVKALERHAGLTCHQDEGGHFRLEGTRPQLPNGLKVPAELGYMRATGQWCEDAKSGIMVEVFCCKTAKAGWVPAGLVSGVRMIDDLKD
jgi:hypothetical protein